MCLLLGRGEPNVKDEDVLAWLIQMTTYVAAELQARKTPTSNAGPRLHDTHTINREPEDFSRWMGWRGQEAQDEETAWPADMVRTERNERHMRAFKKLREENEELWKFLRSLRDELDRRCRDR